jgi:hypothetical protein
VPPEIFPSAFAVQKNHWYGRPGGQIRSGFPQDLIPLFALANDRSRGLRRRPIIENGTVLS